MKTVALWLLLTASTLGAQTFHVTGVADHIRGDNEPAFASALHTRIYTGTVDNVTVTAEEPISFMGGSRITVGHDYPVTKFKPQPGGALHVTQDVDKRGKTFDAWLTVLSVSAP